MTCWREVLTQQFHDIIPGSSIAWVHADAERVHASVAADLEQRLVALLDALVPEGRHVVNAAAVDRDEVIEVDGEAVRVVVPANAIVPAHARGAGRPDRRHRSLDDEPPPRRALGRQRQHHLGHRRRRRT